MVCAWCGQRIAILDGKLRDQPAVNYGICWSCLEERVGRLARSTSANHRRAAMSTPSAATPRARRRVLKR
jgi:hypothetical protein